MRQSVKSARRCVIYRAPARLDSNALRPTSAKFKGRPCPIFRIRVRAVQFLVRYARLLNRYALRYAMDIPYCFIPRNNGSSGLKRAGILGGLSPCGDPRVLE